jgi:hypothetical protein
MDKASLLLEIQGASSDLKHELVSKRRTVRCMRCARQSARLQARQVHTPLVWLMLHLPQSEQVVELLLDCLTEASTKTPVYVLLIGGGWDLGH